MQGDRFISIISDGTGGQVLREKLWSKTHKRGFSNPLYESSIEKHLLQETVALWTAAVAQGELPDLDPQVALGAHYAKLVADGEVRVTESGAKKIKLANEVLKRLVAVGD